MKSTPPPPKAKRIIKRVKPYSQWQLLVQARCADLNLSTRALASKIASPLRTYEHTTLWAWLRAPEGTPPGDTYTTDLNRRLATALDLTPDRLAEAFEESRRKFILADRNPSQSGPLNVLYLLFSTSTRKTWPTEEIVKLLDDVRGR
jgi:hypothetical protein